MNTKVVVMRSHYINNIAGKLIEFTEGETFMFSDKSAALMFILCNNKNNFKLVE